MQCGVSFRNARPAGLGNTGESVKTTDFIIIKAMIITFCVMTRVPQAPRTIFPNAFHYIES